MVVVILSEFPTVHGAVEMGHVHGLASVMQSI